MKLVERGLGNTVLQTDGRERGFSLIEMMVAITVITFGLVSIVGISAYVSRANSTSNTLSVLATAAQDQADILRGAIWSTAFEDPKLTVGGHLDYASSDTNHRVAITGHSCRHFERELEGRCGSGVRPVTCAPSRSRSYKSMRPNV